MYRKRKIKEPKEDFEYTSGWGKKLKQGYSWDEKPKYSLWSGYESHVFLVAKIFSGLTPIMKQLYPLFL